MEGVRTTPDTKTDALLEEFWQGGESPEEMLGEPGLLQGLTKRLEERALAAELTHHLGYVPHARPQAQTGNVRKGTSVKTVETDHGPMALAVPRDRAGTCEPTVVKKRQRRLDGFDDKVWALYAQGMPTRESQTHRDELYGTEVSPHAHFHEYGCGGGGCAPVAEPALGDRLSPSRC